MEIKLSRLLAGTNLRPFFDNFFTSPYFIYKLKEEQIYVCGTVRQNRKGLPKDSKNDDEDIKRGGLD